MLNVFLSSFLTTSQCEEDEWVVNISSCVSSIKWCTMLVS